MTIAPIIPDNFREDSLDSFVRTQEVTEVYRLRDGVCRLEACRFTDDWFPARKREKAKALLSGRYAAWGAFDGERLAGFVALEKELDENRMILDSMHVSREYRRQGLGRALFCRAVDEARARGAKQLYISACSSKETIAFYRAMGCIPADRVIRRLAEEEPCDLQLVCDVNGGTSCKA